MFFDLINKAIVLSKTNISDLQCIKELGEGWVAEETLAISLYSCLKHKDNFIDAIERGITNKSIPTNTKFSPADVWDKYLTKNINVSKL